ncbi:MAG: MFS transporter [Spirochaetes bacterium]|nr:MFS transporter [Spirochaetota bacterium]
MAQPFNKKEWAFIFYDWAESCFTVIVQAFIFPMLYGLLSKGLHGAESIFGFIVSFVSLSVAVLSPILGTIADYKGFKKTFFLIFFWLGIFFTFLIGFYPADPSLWWMILIPYTLASIGYAGTNVFYDSFIVDATDDKNMDRVSTTAYAFGYLGGSTIPLILAIVLLQVLPGLTENGQLQLLGFSFPYDIYTGFRITFFMTGIWWLVFSIPFIKHVKQVHGIEPEPRPIFNSFKRLGKTFKNIKNYRVVFLFLAAYFLYIDGVHTIIAMAVPFATNAIEAVTADNATATLLPILLAIQVAAFVFAMIFSYLTRFFRTRSLLFVTIAVYSLCAIIGFFISEIWHFWVLGMLVATSQGAIQSLSRSYFGKIVPKHMANEFFSFYTIFGRFASVMGPAMVGGISLFVLTAFGDQPGGTMRYGVLSLIILFIAGAILFRLSEKAATGDTAPADNATGA